MLTVSVSWQFIR